MPDLTKGSNTPTFLYHNWSNFGQNVNATMIVIPKNYIPVSKSRFFRAKIFLRLPTLL
jgi:hypothetical protein